MSLFTSLFSFKVPEKSSSKKDIVILTGIAKFDIEIAGGEHYQPALEAICGKRVPRGINRYATARLYLEEKNRQNKNAVRVEIRGKQVGYLGPKDAIHYRQLLSEKDMPNATGQCQAVIQGGWVSSDGRKGDYEVWLDLPSL